MAAATLNPLPPSVNHFIDDFLRANFDGLEAAVGHLAEHLRIRDRLGIKAARAGAMDILDIPADRFEAVRRERRRERRAEAADLARFRQRVERFTARSAPLQ